MAEIDTWLPCAFAALSAILLTRALGYSYGTFHPNAVVILVLTLVSALLASISLTSEPLERLGRTVLPALIGVGILWNFWQLLAGYPLVSPTMRLYKVGAAFLFPHVDMSGFQILTCVAAFITGGLFTVRPWLGKLQFPTLLLIHFFIGVWTIHYSQKVNIDVRLDNQMAADCLLKAENPYEMRVPDIYAWNPAISARLNEPGRVKDGFVTFGYPYMPESAILDVPGFAIAHDYRYSILLLLELSAALIAYARGGWLAQVAAVLFLFMPEMPLFIESGWTDAYVIFFLALTLFTACRFPRALPWILGLFIVAKQYQLAPLPLVWLLFARPVRWQTILDWAWKAALAGTIITLPFILWNPQAFFHSAGLHHVFRKDSLSLLAWWVNQGHPWPAAWLSYLPLIPVTALLLWRSPHTPAAYSRAVGVFFLFMFAFQSQAFLNYYTLITAAFCCAIATAAPTPQPESAEDSHAPLPHALSPVLSPTLT